MSASGYGFVVAGVDIEEYLEVRAVKEVRKIFDPDTGAVKDEIEVTQYTYVIFGREMPLVRKDYPVGMMGQIERTRGYDMQKNFSAWLREHGFVDDEANEHGTVALRYGHPEYAHWPVRHPSGILGVAMPSYVNTWDDEPPWMKVDKLALAALAVKAMRKLAAVGYEGETVDNYFVVTCG